ncbi:hypothetical protein CUMW_096510, partial [Citrus unshiu]
MCIEVPAYCSSSKHQAFCQCYIEVTSASWKEPIKGKAKRRCLIVVCFLSREMGSERKGSEVKKNSRFIFDPFSCRLVVSVVETKTIVGLVNNEGNASALIVCAFVGETKTI